MDEGKTTSRGVYTKLKDNVKEVLTNININILLIGTNAPNKQIYYLLIYKVMNYLMQGNILLLPNKIMYYLLSKVMQREFVVYD